MKDALLAPLFSGPALTPVLDSPQPPATSPKEQPRP
jgi:hypothetical protein